MENNTELDDYELVDLAMNSAYDVLIGNKTIDEIMDQDAEMIFVPDPEISDEIMSEDLIEYFITTEEYEKCDKIKDLMTFRKILNNIINPTNVK